MPTLIWWQCRVDVCGFAAQLHMCRVELSCMSGGYNSVQHTALSWGPAVPACASDEGTEGVGDRGSRGLRHAEHARSVSSKHARHPRSCCLCSKASCKGCFSGHSQQVHSILSANKPVTQGWHLRLWRGVPLNVCQTRLRLSWRPGQRAMLRCAAGGCSPGGVPVHSAPVPLFCMGATALKLALISILVPLFSRVLVPPLGSKGVPPLGIMSIPPLGSKEALVLCPV